MKKHTFSRHYMGALLFALLLISFTAKAQEDIELIPRNIPANHFTNAVGKIKLKQFSEDSALMKLFPGKFYKITQYGETYQLEAWNCNSCKQTELMGDWSVIGSPDTFPRRTGNDTRVIGSVSYKDENGNDNILLATSTTQLGDLILTGRFSCAILGIAIFEKTSSEWVLKAFNPDIICGGSFEHAPMPELLRSDKRVYACTITNSNGPPGGPFYSQLYVMGLSQQNLHVLLKQGLTERIYDGINEWKTTVASAVDTGANLPILILETKGHYGKASFADDYTNFSKDFFGSAGLQKDNFDFTIKTDYAFSNGVYKQRKRKVSIAK